MGLLQTASLCEHHAPLLQKSGRGGKFLSVFCSVGPHEACLCFAGALVNISQHIASLAFEDAPNYEYLRQCLQELPDPRVELHDLAQTCNPCHQTPGSAAAAAGQSYVVSQPPSQHPNDSSILGRPDAWHHHPGQQQGQQQLPPMAASPPCGLQNLVNDGMQQAIVQGMELQRLDTSATGILSSISLPPSCRVC